MRTRRFASRILRRSSILGLTVFITRFFINSIILWAPFREPNNVIHVSRRFCACIKVNRSRARSWGIQS
ncbi:hypothetical protein HanIR_Chr09g0449091 [Helianthus annuus]|nr:hypothetical protein HanIR_Chr09g0449091 [Helianthus annuus]